MIEPVKWDDDDAISHEYLPMSYVIADDAEGLDCHLQ
jgi:hypothetical protein